MNRIALFLLFVACTGTSKPEPSTAQKSATADAAYSAALALRLTRTVG